jgi:isoleucyl-tRNA synthetase
MFASLPDKPDHDALEREILALWERESTFARLREQNASGPRFSFVDGPVTANRMVLGVHSCAATTSATRTGSTARASGSRSGSSGSSA